MRCGDCGGVATIKRKEISRRDICDECWERRDWLLKNYVLVGSAAFQKIQRAMANNTGTAKKQIIALQKELGYKQPEVQQAKLEG